MITIQEKALKYAKKIQGCFLIRTRSNCISCWTGEMTEVTNLSVEVLKYFSKEEIYDEYEYCGIKIYPIATIANTPIFFKAEDKHCYAPG